MIYKNNSMRKRDRQRVVNEKQFQIESEISEVESMQTNSMTENEMKRNECRIFNVLCTLYCAGPSIVSAHTK